MCDQLKRVQRVFASDRMSGEDLIRAANISLPSPLLGRGAGGEGRLTLGFHSHAFVLESRELIAAHSSPRSTGARRHARLRRFLYTSSSYFLPLHPSRPSIQKTVLKQKVTKGAKEGREEEH